MKHANPVRADRYDWAARVILGCLPWFMLGGAVIAAGLVQAPT